MAMCVVRMMSQSWKRTSAISGAEVSAPISSARPQSHQMTRSWTRTFRTGLSWNPRGPQLSPLSTMASSKERTKELRMTTSWQLQMSMPSAL